VRICALQRWSDLEDLRPVVTRRRHNSRSALAATVEVGRSGWVEPPCRMRCLEPVKSTALVVASFLVIAAGCSASHQSSVTSTSTTAIGRANGVRPCASTMTAVPSDRVPSDVAHGQQPVVGSGALWTIEAALRLHGDHQLRGWVIKMPWFTRPFGIPTIAARRLDGMGTFHATANEAFDQNGKWVASLLVFSTAGCWEVTGRYHASSFRFEARIGTSNPSGSRAPYQPIRARPARDAARFSPCS